MEPAVNVVQNVSDVAHKAARDSGKRSDENINYAVLRGLHPDIWNLPCGCSLVKGNGEGTRVRKEPTVHIQKNGAVIHMACGAEIARIVRREPDGGM